MVSFESIEGGGFADNKRKSKAIFAHGMTEAMEQPWFVFCKESEETTSRVDQLRSNISETSSFESSYGFQQEVEGLLFQCPTQSQWQGTGDTSLYLPKESESGSHEDMLRDQEGSEFWHNSDYQVGFESYCSQNETPEKNGSLERSLGVNTQNDSKSRQLSSPRASFSEDSRETHVTPFVYEDISSSAKYVHKTPKDELDILLDRDENSLSWSGSLSDLLGVERYSSCSHSSDIYYAEKPSLLSNREIVQPPTSHSKEYSREEQYSQNGLQWMGTEMEKPCSDSYQRNCTLDLAKRKRRSKATPKDLLEQDASVLYTPSNWSQSDMTIHRRMALARYYSKKQRRNYGRKVRYECRKRLAFYRPRLSGRFVKVPCNSSEFDGASQKAGIS